MVSCMTTPVEAVFARPVPAKDIVLPAVTVVSGSTLPLGASALPRRFSESTLLPLGASVAPAALRSVTTARFSY